MTPSKIKPGNCSAYRALFLMMYQMIYDIANELIPLYLFPSASAPLLFPAAVTLPSFIYHPAAHQSNDDKDKNSDTHS